MKNRDIEKRLKSEIESDTPDVLKNVVASSYIEKPTPVPRPTKKVVTRRVMLPVALSFCLLIALTIVGLAVFLPKDDVVVSNYSYATVQTGASGAVASAEGSAAPSVSFTADSDGVIESVRADNEEGQIVLNAIEGNITGAQLDAGVKLVAEAFAKLGYIDVTATADDGQIGVSVTLASEGKLNDINAQIKGTVEKFFMQKGIYAAVSANAYTKEELVDIVGQFDANATLSDGLSVLTQKLAQRKSYFEEEVDILSSLDNEVSERMALLKVYAATTVENVQEIIDGLDNIPAPFKPLVEPLQANLQNQLNEIKALIDESFAQIETQITPLITTLSGCVEAVSAYADFSSYIADVPEDMQELAAYISATVTRRTENLIATFKAAYDAPRAEITADVYADFLKSFN